MKFFLCIFLLIICFNIYAAITIIVTTNNSGYGNLWIEDYFGQTIYEIVDIEFTYGDNYFYVDSITLGYTIYVEGWGAHYDYDTDNCVYTGQRIIHLYLDIDGID